MERRMWFSKRYEVIKIKKRVIYKTTLCNHECLYKPYRLKIKRGFVVLIMSLL